MHDIIGRRVRDKITKFEGVVTGRVEYITGCNQLLISPGLKADGSLGENQWFDEQRCDLVESAKIEIDNGASPGCDTPAPNR